MHIEKEKIRVTMLVDRFRLVGDMHRYPGARLLDLVNVKETTFMPMTDVEIYSLNDGKLLQRTSFLGVNVRTISLFYPVETEAASAPNAT